MVSTYEYIEGFWNILILGFLQSSAFVTSLQISSGFKFWKIQMLIMLFH
jgi:hypothetical protein